MSNTDEVLQVLLAQAGDRDAFNALLTSMHRPLLRYVASLAGADAAEDIVQEVSLQIYRKLKWLREPSYFRAWSYRIASRVAFAYLRRSRVWRSFEADPEVLDSIPALEVIGTQIDWESSLTALLADVSPASRAVLLLHYQHELSLEEVAAALEIPIGIVKSRLSYGITTLRRKIDRKETR